MISLLAIILFGSTYQIVASHTRPIRCFNYTNETIAIQNASGDEVSLAPDAVQNVQLTDNAPFNWSITSKPKQPLLKSSFFEHSKYLSFKQPWGNPNHVICSPDTSGWWRKLKLGMRSYAHGLTWGWIKQTENPTLISDENIITHARRSGKVASVLITSAIVIGVTSKAL